MMLDFIAAYMAPFMFAVLVTFLLVGFPVAFALAANGMSHSHIVAGTS